MRTRSGAPALDNVQKLIRPGYSPLPVGIWLISIAGMVLAMIVIGGYTRLSNSGLSMTRWKPVGYRYPRSPEDWEREFALYRDYPEFGQNPAMDVEGFKRIFNVEYFHRVFGNLIGVVFAAPMLYFWQRGYFTPAMKRRAALLLFAGGLQGVVGWWMVKSGLGEKPSYQTRQRVSTYRLVTHNAMAVSLYAYTLYSGLRLLRRLKPSFGQPATRKGVFRLAVLLAHLVALNILTGAMSAGIAAGDVYNTWPLMNGKFLPEGYWDSELGWRNLFENKACVQFNHRMCAYLTYIATMYSLLRLRRLSLPARVSFAGYLVALLVNYQLYLGVTMITSKVDLHNGILHQENGLMVLTAVILLLALSSR